MAAMITADAATVLATNVAQTRVQRISSGGIPQPLPADLTTFLADYIRGRAALVLVKADGAYASLDSATKTAVDACLT